MRAFNYYSIDWATRSILEELPLQGMQYTEPLNTSSSNQWSADLVLDRDSDDLPSTIDRMAIATTPRRTLLAVEMYDDEDTELTPRLVYVGWIVTRDRSNGSSWKISGYEFGGIYDEVPYEETRVYQAAYDDMLFVGKDVLTWTQAQPGLDFGLVLDFPNSEAGYGLDLKLAATDAKSVGDILRTGTQLHPGYDYTFVGTLAGNVLTMHYQDYAPYKGVSVADSPLIWSFPGGITKYTYSEDGTLFARRLLEIGGRPGGSDANANAAPLTAYRELVNSDMFPRITKVYDRGDLDKQSQLEAAADEDARLLQLGVPVVASVEVALNDEQHPYGTYGVGDHATFVLTDEYNFNGSVEFVARIVEITPNLRAGTAALTLDGAVL